MSLLGYFYSYPCRHMMNVTGVWKDGITGKGVTSAMVDDGIDYENPDLAPNFVRLLEFT